MPSARCATRAQSSPWSDGQPTSPRHSPHKRGRSAKTWRAGFLSAGEYPAVERPARYYLTINLKTNKSVFKGNKGGRVTGVFTPQ